MPPSLCFRCQKETAYNDENRLPLNCFDCQKTWHLDCHIPPVPFDEWKRRAEAGKSNPRHPNGLFGWKCRRCSKKKPVSAASAVKKPAPLLRPADVLTVDSDDEEIQLIAAIKIDDSDEEKNPRSLSNPPFLHKSPATSIPSITSPSLKTLSGEDWTLSDYNIQPGHVISSHGPAPKIDDPLYLPNIAKKKQQELDVTMHVMGKPLSPRKRKAEHMRRSDWELLNLGI
ncbi:hypothetical protein C8J56DRAFT_911642 [Mycena floridula]|nr:hypothetical protein C8J56DRAFT_911642 [Mycena floridula]